MEGEERWGRSGEAAGDAGPWRARRDESEKGWYLRDTQNKLMVAQQVPAVASEIQIKMKTGAACSNGPTAGDTWDA